MNTGIIRYILGHVIKLESLFLLQPCLVALIYQERQGFMYLAVAALCYFLGSILTSRKAKDSVFYLKEGCIATVLCWTALSFFGALPFVFTGEIPHFTSSIFETVSGITTTGATILGDVETLCHATLFWRSFTHWIGGMGVLVFLLAIVPMSGASHFNLMRAESPGPSVGKLVPKLRYTARILYLIYIALTLIQVVILLIAKMPCFDAICISIGTAGTGGFGILNSSMADYSPAVQWIVTVFMILFGINFNAYYLIIFGQALKAFKMEEVRAYLLVILSAILLIAMDIHTMFDTAEETLRHAAFQVASIISSSGFATTDFDLWPGFSKTILVLLMFIGACAGSTGGGMKVSRFVIIGKGILKELNSYIHPRSVKQITMDEKEVEPEVIRSVSVYMITFFAIFVASIMLVALEEKDLVTNFTAVATTLNNIGPGLSLVGPTQNFGHFTDLSKWVLIIDMLAGRLELFPLLIMFHPAIWHELIVKRVRRARHQKYNQ